MRETEPACFQRSDRDISISIDRDRDGDRDGDTDWDRDRGSNKERDNDNKIILMNTQIEAAFFVYAFVRYR